MNLTVNQNPAPPQDTEIRAKRISYVQALHAGRQPEVKSIQEPPSVPTHVRTLFELRFQLEQEIRRLYARRITATEIALAEAIAQRKPTIIQMVQRLVAAEVLSNTTLEIVRDVWAICSAAIHGDNVSTEQSKFALDVGGDLMTVLRAMNSEPGPPDDQE